MHIPEAPAVHQTDNIQAWPHGELKDKSKILTSSAMAGAVVAGAGELDAGGTSAITWVSTATSLSAGCLQWGFVGKKERDMEDEGPEAVRYILFTHLHFDVHFNGPHGDTLPEHTCCNHRPPTRCPSVLNQR